jgi:chromosomal replication initiation ATPase DnaA
MGGPSRGGVVRYRRFVEEGLVREIASPWEAVHWQAVLGSESFLRRVRDRIGEAREKRGPRAMRRAGKERLQPDEVLRAVSGRYDLSVEELRQEGGYGLEARNVALWLIWERCGLSQEEIGRLFGGMKGAAVAQRLRRLKAASRGEAQALNDEMSNV